MTTGTTFGWGKAGSVGSFHSWAPTKIAASCWGASARRRQPSTFLLARPHFRYLFGVCSPGNVYSVSVGGSAESSWSFIGASGDSGRDFMRTPTTQQFTVTAGKLNQAITFVSCHHSPVAREGALLSGTTSSPRPMLSLRRLCPRMSAAGACGATYVARHRNPRCNITYNPLAQAVGVSFHNPLRTGLRLNQGP